MQRSTLAAAAAVIGLAASTAHRMLTTLEQHLATDGQRRQGSESIASDEKPDPPRQGEEDVRHRVLDRQRERADDPGPEQTTTDGLEQEARGTKPQIVHGWLSQGRGRSPRLMARAACTATFRGSRR